MKTLTEKKESSIITRKFITFDNEFKCCKDCGIKAEDTYILPTGRCKHCQQQMDLILYNAFIY